MDDPDIEVTASFLPWDCVPGAAIQLIAVHLVAKDISSCRLVCKSWSFDFALTVRKLSICSNGSNRDRARQQRLISKAGPHTHVRAHLRQDVSRNLDHLLDDVTSNSAITHFAISTDVDDYCVSIAMVAQLADFLRRSTCMTTGFNWWPLQQLPPANIEPFLAYLKPIYSHLYELGINAVLTEKQLSIITELTHLNKLSIGLVRAADQDRWGRTSSLQQNVASLAALSMLSDLSLHLQSSADDAGTVNFPSWQHLTRLSLSRDRHRDAVLLARLPGEVCASLLALELNGPGITVQTRVKAQQLAAVTHVRMGDQCGGRGHQQLPPLPALQELHNIKFPPGQREWSAQVQALGVNLQVLVMSPPNIDSCPQLLASLARRCRQLRHLTITDGDHEQPQAPNNCWDDEEDCINDTYGGYGEFEPAYYSYGEEDDLSRRRRCTEGALQQDGSRVAAALGQLRSLHSLHYHCRQGDLQLASNRQLSSLANLRSLALPCYTLDVAALPAGLTALTAAVVRITDSSAPLSYSFVLQQHQQLEVWQRRQQQLLAQQDKLRSMSGSLQQLHADTQAAHSEQHQLWFEGEAKLERKSVETSGAYTPGYQCWQQPRHHKVPAAWIGGTDEQALAQFRRQGLHHYEERSLGLLLGSGELQTQLKRQIGELGRVAQLCQTRISALQQQMAAEEAQQWHWQGAAAADAEGAAEEERAMSGAPSEQQTAEEELSEEQQEGQEERPWHWQGDAAAADGGQHVERSDEEDAMSDLLSEQDTADEQQSEEQQEGQEQGRWHWQGAAAADGGQHAEGSGGQHAEGFEEDDYWQHVLSGQERAEEEQHEGQQELDDNDVSEEDESEEDESDEEGSEPCTDEDSEEGAWQGPGGYAQLRDVSLCFAAHSNVSQVLALLAPVGAQLLHVRVSVSAAESERSDYWDFPMEETDEASASAIDLSGVSSLAALHSLQLDAPWAWPQALLSLQHLAELELQKPVCPSLMTQLASKAGPGVLQACLSKLAGTVDKQNGKHPRHGRHAAPPGCMCAHCCQMPATGAADELCQQPGPGAGPGWWQQSGAGAELWQQAGAGGAALWQQVGAGAGLWQQPGNHTLAPQQAAAGAWQQAAAHARWQQGGFHAGLLDQGMGPWPQSGTGAHQWQQLRAGAQAWIGSGPAMWQQGTAAGMDSDWQQGGAAAWLPQPGDAGAGLHQGSATAELQRNGFGYASMAWQQYVPPWQQAAAGAGMWHQVTGAGAGAWQQQQPFAQGWGQDGAGQPCAQVPQWQPSQAHAEQWRAGRAGGHRAGGNGDKARREGRRSSRSHSPRGRRRHQDRSADHRRSRSDGRKRRRSDSSSSRDRKQRRKRSNHEHSCSRSRSAGRDNRGHGHHRHSSRGRSGDAHYKRGESERYGGCAGRNRGADDRRDHSRDGGCHRHSRSSMRSRRGTGGRYDDGQGKAGDRRGHRGSRGGGK